ncbi:Beta-galactosidase 9 [Dionaea muscipula]
MIIRAQLPVPWLLLLALQTSVIAGAFFRPFNVTYDHRALIIDGKRRMLISAGIHYPRATPEMWPSLISKSKEGGADVIQTYVFWNGHEPVRGQYNSEERYDLITFVKLVGAHGLYLHLRVGPYVCAEWNFGGFPVWLRDIPGIEFRTNNAPFKEEMQQFVTKIIDMMRAEMLFCWQGGPIIMLQIENEYGNVEKAYGVAGKDYVKWAANMAAGLGAGVPWVMCIQTDAPKFIIDSCNGYYCDGFRPNSNKKPVLWTENWDGWYTAWGGRIPHRPAEDIAFAVARFFQRGGSFQNYYMYFGGTNFGRTSGGPFYVTSYDYDAPIDEYGLLSQPKWGHLKDLHAAIKLSEPALVAVDSPQYLKLGPLQEGHVYRKKINGKWLSPGMSGNICAAFLANIDQSRAASVTFQGQNYSLPPWSVSILPDCKNVAFNTAKVRAQASIKDTMFSGAHVSDSYVRQNVVLNDRAFYIFNNWTTMQEPVSIWSENNFTCNGILEHLNVTKDSTDYLWYFTRVYVSSKDVSFWEENGVNSTLTIGGIRDVVRIFVNGQLAGSAFGHWVKVVQPVQLVEGYNILALLSETVGLQNYGAFFEKDGAGIRGQIKLIGLSNGDIDLAKFPWTYQVGLKGESEKIFTADGNEGADWTPLSLDAIPSTLSWYKACFDAPDGLDPVALDLKSMGKGQAWVNGHHIGRYWIMDAPIAGCQETCDYRGPYNSDKCNTNCGKPTQTWYHIPRSWLQASNNVVVIFEEIGGNPFEISIETYSTQTICALVQESDNPPPSKWSSSYIGLAWINRTTPEMQLQCDHGHFISIAFASYGTPQGSCQKYSRGDCHASNSLDVVSRVCQGRDSCSIEVSNAMFGFDPCQGTVKSLAVEARCVQSWLIGSEAI